MLLTGSRDVLGRCCLCNEAAINYMTACDPELGHIGVSVSCSIPVDDSPDLLHSTTMRSLSLIVAALGLLTTSFALSMPGQQPLDGQSGPIRATAGWDWQDCGSFLHRS